MQLLPRRLCVYSLAFALEVRSQVWCVTPSPLKLERFALYLARLG